MRCTSAVMLELLVDLVNKEKDKETKRKKRKGTSLLKMEYSLKTPQA